MGEKKYPGAGGASYPPGNGPTDACGHQDPGIGVPYPPVNGRNDPCGKADPGIGVPYSPGGKYREGHPERDRSEARRSR